MTLSDAEVNVEFKESQWRFGICQCTRNFDWCRIGAAMPGVLLIRIAEHLNKVTQVKAILLLLLIIMGLGAIADIFEVIGEASDNYTAEIVFRSLAG